MRVDQLERLVAAYGLTMAEFYSARRPVDDDVSAYEEAR